LYKAGDLWKAIPVQGVDKLSYAGHGDTPARVPTIPLSFVHFDMCKVSRNREESLYLTIKVEMFMNSEKL
jgi:hypothetical protein